jgi:hypothetical protein
MATTHCAQCERQISLLMKTCPYCGAPVAELGTLATPSRPETHGPLYEIAYRQKLVVYAVLLDLLGLPSIGFLAEPFETPLATTLSDLATVVSLCLIVFSIWAYYRLGVALGIPTSVICVGAACLIFPLVSLLVLVGIARIAAKKLRRAGMEVGLLGANLREIPKDR